MWYTVGIPRSNNAVSSVKVAVKKKKDRNTIWERYFTRPR